MKLKGILLICCLFSFSLFFSNCSHKNKSSNPAEQTPGNKGKEIYTCPMHPGVTSDKHGKCPTCGMDLVKKEERTVYACPGDCEYLCNKAGKCPYCRKGLIKKTEEYELAPTHYEVMKP
jgi:hypothetical protein